MVVNINLNQFKQRETKRMVVVEEEVEVGVRF